MAMEFEILKLFFEDDTSLEHIIKDPQQECWILLPTVAVVRKIRENKNEEKKKVIILGLIGGQLINRHRHRHEDLN